MIFKKWFHQTLHCSRLSDKDITDYFMMKIDEFSATNQDPNTSCKIAAQVTGLQKPANTTQNARKICILLNEQLSLMKMESSAMILPRGHLSKEKGSVPSRQTWRLHYCRPQEKVMDLPIFNAVTLSQAS